jgi:hypothetical protein
MVLMSSRTTVEIELAADGQHARDLAAGGVFAPGCALGLNEECALIVRGTGGALRVHARVVFLDPGRGAGLELLGFGREMKERLAALVATRAPGDAAGAGAGGAIAAGSGELDLSAAADAAAAETAAAADADAATDAAAAADADAADLGDAPGVSQLDRDRLRNLPLAQQIRRAHSVDLQERILLERMYGKNVWEALLRNPRLTSPEVARIARMATLPRPLIEAILNNGAWLQLPDVRRALLANPRLQLDQVLRVLRLLSKPELKLAAVQSTYPHPVRDAAKRMLREP